MSKAVQLTREDLKDWILSKDCKFEPLEGINMTGSQIKAVNPKYPNAYSYLDIPFNSRPVPNFVVCKVCDDLYIEAPDCVKDHTPLVNHLKEKFKDKRYPLR